MSAALKWLSMGQADLEKTLEELKRTSKGKHYHEQLKPATDKIIQDMKEIEEARKLIQEFINTKKQY